MPNIWLTILNHLNGEARAAAVMRRVEAERRERVRPMRSDPLRGKFVDLILQGDTWPDEDIAFNIDPSATHVCVHLRPVEQRMREEGILMRLWGPGKLRTPCRVDPEKMKREVQLPPSVAYVEQEFKERSILDPDVAFIQCDICTSRIEVVHADSARPDTPWFPG